MADDPLSFAELVNQLPEKIRSRFTSLGSYTNELIIEVKNELEIHRNLSYEETEFIHLMVLVYSLNKFMHEGSNAARKASQAFENLNQIGFQVGSTNFTSRNRNTNRGDRLANELMNSINQLTEQPILAGIMRNSRSIRELIYNFLREIPRNA